jgi:hypothetical protein
MGRFVVTTATNVSRTAHEPASWAPLTGSWMGGSLVSEIIDGRSGMKLSYSHDENASQGGAGDDEDSAAEQDHQADLLHWPET